jgi:cytochrome c peroxidase
MSRAQCGTCHFVPQFGGVKPPYIGSEFEVLGVPADSGGAAVSPDSGRFGIHPAVETRHAFRTTTVRNIERTPPYMHNGVFRTLDQVLHFYDIGGGHGLGFDIPEQTLPTDSLHLTQAEKDDLKAFLHSLNETIVVPAPPPALPASSIRSLNRRRVGGAY